MNYLLDTHTLLWVLFDEERLSKKSIIAFKNPKNILFVSIVSYWEISLKYGLGKLELTGITPDELPYYAKEAGIQTSKVSEITASTFHKLPRSKHKDPFDRLIIWQAIHQNHILITKDRKIKEYQKHGLKVLW
ncbi:MAG: type II toxin-antitoxin system VapC family toxin [Balneolaceae bacterium]|nr:type II toxin-antitoxin system VapC family toxin [Balneolaceae bacterium]